MDMERPLKFEGQYFGIQTDSDFNQCFHNNLVYENYVQYDDSTQQNSKSDFSLQIIQKIKATVNIALTPLEDLIQIGRRDTNWCSVGEATLKRNLWKTKLIQKRQRAKNRKIQRNCTKVINTTFEVTSIDRNEDVKKQKNRLSAQISRDKKKQLFNKLQMQNAQLKKTIEEFNKNNTQLQNKIKKQQEQPKKKPQKLFKTLLIFLGIIFLFNLFKNISTQRAQKNSQETLINKIELSKKEKQFVQTQLKTYGINLPTQFMQPPKAQDFPNKNIIIKIIEAKNALF